MSHIIELGGVVAHSEADTLDVKLDSFTDARVPALLSVNEEMLRMNEMMKMYAPDMPEQPVQMTLSLNKNNAIIKRLQDGSYGENAEKVAKQIYSLSLLSQKKLSAEEMESFFDNSCELLTLI